VTGKFSVPPDHDCSMMFATSVEDVQCSRIDCSISLLSVDSKLVRSEFAEYDFD
jgi:hypothetical protein